MQILGESSWGFKRQSILDEDEHLSDEIDCHPREYLHDCLSRRLHSAWMRSAVDESQWRDSCRGRVAGGLLTIQ